MLEKNSRADFLILGFWGRAGHVESMYELHDGNKSHATHMMQSESPCPIVLQDAVDEERLREIGRFS